MKIAILGYAGSGKSTLARALGELYGVPVLHLDTVQFMPDWKERPKDEQLEIVQRFMDENDGWVIDGNYSNLLQPRRLEEADKVVFLHFNRLAALWRVTKRYFRYRGKSRPDMADGCSEKLDAEFIAWVLWRGRTKQKRSAFKQKQKTCGAKGVVLKNQRQIDRWLDEERSKTHAGSL